MSSVSALALALCARLREWFWPWTSVHFGELSFPLERFVCLLHVQAHARSFLRPAQEVSDESLGYFGFTRSIRGCG